MKKMKSVLATAALLGGSFASAQVATVALPSPIKKTTSKLSQLRAAEDLEKWPECARLGAQTYAQNTNVKGWVLMSWLRCARKAEAKTNGTALSKAALAAFDAAPGLRSSGDAWSKSLRQEAIRTRFQVLERESGKPAAGAEIGKQLELLEGGEDRESKARALALYGDWANSLRDAEAAKTFYEQSLAQRENRAVRDKYAQALLAVGPKKESAVVTAAPAAPLVSEFVSDAERKFEERFESSQKNNDLLALVEDCVSYLNKFPHGRSAKWAHDKVLDVYFLFYEQAMNGEEKWTVLRDRALNLIERAEWSRLGDWARLLHRRGDFPGSLRLADKALDKTGTSAWGGILNYVAGRSAQFMGEEKRAQRYFEAYAEQHSAGDEIGEVLFRLGLVHLRQNQAPSAVAIFERLLSLKGQDRYELSARYWLVRALQNSKSVRAAKEAEVILSKFPFSYFGLKLKAESLQGQLEWPYPLETAETLKANFKFTAPQKKAWDRLRTLTAAGWRWEALQEANEFPMPEDGRMKALLAQSLNDAQAYPLVIKLLNQASDQSIDFRTKDLMSLGLPKDFQPVVEAEAKKNNLQPILVWSLIRQESAFNTRAVSTSNAMGLMQLIPPTAREVAQTLKLGALEIPDDVFQIDRNIPMGTSYLAQMIRQFQGSVPLGLAAYNAGPGRMGQFVKMRADLRESMTKPPQSPMDELWMEELPWYETSFYVKAILRNTLLYRLLDQRRVAVEMNVWSDLVLSPKSTEGNTGSVTTSR